MGEWQRPAAFPRAGENHASKPCIREVKLIRNGVGLFDASSLGKVELIGSGRPRVRRPILHQQSGDAKRGRVHVTCIMLRETGVIFDDGTVVALDKDRVLLTTTSGGAGRVAAWLEEWHQCEWPELRVVIVPVTDQWATVALTGRHARSILQRLKPECDISNSSFPHLGFRATKLLGGSARIYRVSFSGELTYEINVPSDRACELWEVLLSEGRAVGIEPFGVDALLHLRMEKGFLHVGAETDGTTIPNDVGFGKLASSKPSHYIGKRSLSLLDNVRPDRLQLVGLTSMADPLPIGAHLRLDGSPDATDGWVTSAGALSTNGKSVALAMLRAGRENMSQIVTVHDAGQVVSHARVVAPMFYDPNGDRMNA